MNAVAEINHTLRKDHAVRESEASKRDTTNLSWVWQNFMTSLSLPVPRYVRVSHHEYRRDMDSTRASIRRGQLRKRVTIRYMFLPSCALPEFDPLK